MLSDLSVALQGFGNVGSHFARLAALGGCTVVAIADHTATIRREGGIDLPDLLHWVEEHRVLRGFPGAEEISPEELFDQDVDVFVPAALENQISEERARRMRCRLVLEAANGPTTPGGERVLAERGIEVCPDILANAGGVTVSYFEWLQNKSSEFWKAEEVDGKLRDTLWAAHDRVVEKRRELSCSFRDAAYAVALARLADVYDRRRMFP